MAISVKEWITPSNLTLLRGWARDGLTDVEIAHRIGISVRTFHRWKKYEVMAEGPNQYPIKNALKDGKEVIDYAVENVLLKKALEGDTTAMIFWLKNRRPDKWRDKAVIQEEKSYDANEASIRKMNEYFEQRANTEDDLRASD